MFLVYSLLYALGIILTAPYYLWRMRGRILSAADWRERLGFLPAQFEDVRLHGPGSVWIHAVSMGETLAVEGLVKALQAEYAERRIFLSCVTRTGREVGEARMPGVAGHFYLPLDFRFSVRRTFAQVQPALLIIVETELWPNLLRAARENGTRVVLVNARLSTRSFRGYRLARPFMRRILNCIDWIGAQTNEDAGRFIALGASLDRVVVTGNLKFDGKPPQAGRLSNRLRAGLEAARRAPVWIAASTMPGEETMLLQAWDEIRKQNPASLFILVPRHPNRFEEVAKLLAQSGRSFVRRTALEPEEQNFTHQLTAPEILLLDTVGELAGILDVADLVFVGGSLVPAGGHNLLEPAYWGKPILFGPHMENFRDIAQLFLEQGAASTVQNPADLAHRVHELLQDKRKRKEMGNRARQLMEQGSGATERTLERLRIMLGMSVPTHSPI
ncbi:MAG TPA: 3-deoxy-D-manno-octulosonic acid transferase [Terriglobia bacterium]|nr:3-deoxy-D-manno-octulosonic acid transferase [Terriglobia bacterium]